MQMKFLASCWLHVAKLRCFCVHSSSQLSTSTRESVSHCFRDHPLLWSTPTEKLRRRKFNPRSRGCCTNNVLFPALEHGVRLQAYDSHGRMKHRSGIFVGTFFIML